MTASGKGTKSCHQQPQKQDPAPAKVLLGLCACSAGVQAQTSLGQTLPLPGDKDQAWSSHGSLSGPIAVARISDAHPDSHAESALMPQHTPLGPPTMPLSPFCLLLSIGVLH